MCKFAELNDNGKETIAGKYQKQSGPAFETI